MSFLKVENERENISWKTGVPCKQCDAMRVETYASDLKFSWDPSGAQGVAIFVIMAF